MKFFSTALAAFAVGSAVAAPILDALTTPCTSGCKDESGVGAPDVPSPCTPGGFPIGLPNPGHVVGGGPVKNADVIVVVGTVADAVVSAEADVKAHLKLIAAIVASVDIDAQALLELIVLLKVDLKVLVDCIPTLNGLTLDADALVAADLEAILYLVAHVQALIVEIEVCLEALAVLHADILVVIGAELQACLDIIVVITTPVIEFALAVVAIVTATVHVNIIAQITAVVGDLTNNCSVLGSVLGPVLKGLGLKGLGL